MLTRLFHCPRIAAAAAALALTLAVAEAQTPPTSDDFDVTFIERTPRYDYDATPNSPAPGEPVTFHGHIRSWCEDAAPSVSYRWLLDGVPVANGTLTNINPGDERVVTWQWNWSADEHWIRLEVDHDSQWREVSEHNNAVEDRTNAIIAGFWVEQSLYDYFQEYQNEMHVGSNSWEDWIQRQMAKQNELYESAIWPISPSGVLDRVRIDKILVVPDDSLPLGPWGLPTNHPDVRDKTVDLMWGFPATLLDGSMYTNHTSVSEDNPFYIEKSLIHELGHARYLIDCYGFDVHNTASHHAVQIWEGDTYVAGSQYMPFLAFGEVLYYNQSGGVMSGPYGFQWSPYESGALNLIAGQRALCGNYNAPCNIGVFLQDLPSHNHVRIVDRGGRARVGADVRAYQATGASGWYGKTFDNTPDLLFTADQDGYVHMGRNPFSDGQIQHSYGIANGVVILRIEHEGQIWYRFVEVTDLNMQYWQGNTEHAYYTIEVTGTEDPRGDLNCDGAVDFDDINAFVLALSGETAYAAQYPTCNWLNADCNLDGNVDFDDINAFVAVLGG